MQTDGAGTKDIEPARRNPSIPRGGKPVPSRWLTLREIAEDLQVTPSTVYRWAARGEPWFPRAIRLTGRQLRVRSDWYEEWLEHLEQQHRSA